MSSNVLNPKLFVHKSGKLFGKEEIAMVASRTHQNLCLLKVSSLLNSMSLPRGNLLQYQ
jgi:hypothetical protein